MNEDTQVVESVEQAPAAVETVVEKSVPVVEELTGRQREKWLKEPSEFPRRAPKVSKQQTDPAESSTAEVETPKSDVTEESSTSPSPGKAEVAETAAESAPAEPTQVEGKPASSEAEKRIKSLVSDVKLLKQRLQQYEQPKVETKQPEKSAETQVDSKRPDPKKFETLDEYFEALSDYKVEKALSGERQRVAKEQQDSMQARRVAEERQQWNQRVEGARKKHADFDDIALNPDLPVTEGSAIDWWVMNSEHGAEVLYHYGRNPEQLESLNKLPPIEAARELAKLEVSLLTPKPVPVPKAPRPPSEANPTGKVDPLAAALQAGDFATYRRLKDAEERKGRS